MIETIRIVLVDPSARTTTEFSRQLERLNEVDLLETCTSYSGATKRIAAHAPDIVIVVTDYNSDDGTVLITKLVDSFPGVAILPAGEEHDASLILKVIRAGAREFLPLPCPTLELVEMLRALNPRQGGPVASGPRGPRLIAVTGAAGGVGCTSIAVNLATNIAKLSHLDTVIADFDLLLGSLEESLAVIPDNTLEAVVRNLDVMEPTLLKRWLPRHKSGLYILPHPVTLEESARLDHDQVLRVVSLLKESFESVVVDTSKGLQATDFLAFDAAEVILVVLQLNVNCVRNTVRLTNYLRSFEGFPEKIRLVVNRSNSPQSEISIKKAEDLLKCPMKYQVSNSTKLFRPARTLGVPIDEVEGGAGSRVHQELLTMAQDLLPFALETSKPKKKLFASFR